MKEILCFGDSNTYGLIPGTTRRYDRETRWTGILAEKLYDKGYRIIDYVEEPVYLTMQQEMEEMERKYFQCS